jgi:SAM-dependent methyltransferase
MPAGKLSPLPPMDVGKQVRLLYERRPYPTLGKTGVRRPQWRLPPIEWINAVWQPLRATPARILVAGCGTGIEAFALQRRFPHSEIVGVDFCPRSIAVARRAQKRARSFRGIRFLTADLTSPRSLRIAGNNFDFISCHGVLSYIPKPHRVLRNLAHLLAPDGALYLGVNGPGHFSTGWRQVLPDFGFRMAELPEGSGLRKYLELCETLVGFPAGTISEKEASYLASDLFSPLILNLPLADWWRMARKAGLHFRDSYAAQRMLWPVINSGSYYLLMPRSRAEVAGFLDRLSPSSFYQLLFTRQPEPAPPWHDLNQLLAWRPLLAMHLRKHHWPRPRGSWGTSRDLKIKTAATNTLIELRVPEWEIEILRNARGEPPLRRILANIEPAIRPVLLKQQLYLLYQLNVLNLLPPPRRGTAA